MGDDWKAVLLWRALYDAGVYVNVALHPAVPPGGALLRTSVMATHDRATLDRALDAFARGQARLRGRARPAARRGRVRTADLTERVHTKRPLFANRWGRRRCGVRAGLSTRSAGRTCGMSGGGKGAESRDEGTGTAEIARDGVSPVDDRSDKKTFDGPSGRVGRGEVPDGLNTATKPAPQHMRALEQANRVRLARAELKRSVADGEVDAWPRW